ncbi:thioredoxin domain-containing protein [Croceicoccus bisphenolivorans]|uniref:thioredoxin domain-containing protein n=1 Tax=Croceicoccus bisphenolivorans TaxID=1783232 RepID=UPI0008365E33|nr:thioredoxin domain-containing protein [Croceicoccus bisphenolivorans]
MTRSHFRTALTLLVAPLALAACDKTEEAATNEQAAPIENIAPPAGTEWSDTVVKTEKGGYLMGNPDAPIKLVEFGALSCSHCADFATASFDELRGEYVNSGRVSYELRYFMLNSLDMPLTLLATCSTPEASIALAEQIWGNQHQFFEALQQSTDAQRAAIEKMPLDQRFVALSQLMGLTDFVTARGIALDQANACLADGKKAEELAEQTRTEATEYEITGTPTFLLNGEKLEAMDWNDMKARLQRAGAR